MRVDILLSAGGPVDAARRAKELEVTGADGLFSFEDSHDVFFPLVLASTTTELELMTNVAIAFPRSPMHLAHAAYDLQLLTRGRFRLGLGSQVRAHITRRYGSDWSEPAARMRDWVRAIKSIFATWETGERLDFRGRFTTHTLMTPVFNPGPNPYGPPPVLVGALGPYMTRVAAEVADGVLVMPFNSARHFRERTLPNIERGLDKAGRDRADLEVIAEVICAVGTTPDELQAATAGVRGLLSFYASTPAYVPVLEVEGWEEIQPKLNVMSKQGEWLAMSGLIDDIMLRTLAVVGTPQECADQIAERFGDHAQRVCCYFPGYPISDDRVGEVVAAIKQR